MHGSLDPNLVGKQFERGMFIVRHAADVDLDILEGMAQRTGNYLLSSPAIFGVRIVGDNDLARIEQATGVDKLTLVKEIGNFVSEFTEIPEAPVDKIKVIARSPEFTYVRVGLDDEVVSHVDDERLRIFREFSAEKAFQIEVSHPFSIVPVRDEAMVEPVIEELFNQFYGGRVALKSAAVEVVQH